MKLRRRRRVKAFPQKRSQLGGSGLLPENGVQGFARPVHLAGQRLRRRPDKCDAGRRPSGRRIPRPAASGRTRALCRSSSSHRNRFAGFRREPCWGGDKTTGLHFSAFLHGGGITTLGVRFMPLKRWTPAGHGGVFAVFMPPRCSPCVG